MDSIEEETNGIVALDGEKELGDDYNKFIQSLHRVRKKGEKQEITGIQKVLLDAKKVVEVKAAEKYLQKELHAACQRQPVVAPAELSEYINSLQQCIINKAGVEFVASNTAIHAELQAELSLLTLDQGAISPTAMAVMTESHKALEGDAELAKVLQEVDQKQRQLVEQRMELAALHRDVKRLWQERDDRKLSNDRQTDTEEMTRMREKLQGREGRVEMLVHFLLTLYTGLSPRWGTDGNIMKVLAACELYKSRPSDADWETIFKNLAM